MGESVTQHKDVGSGPQNTVIAVYFHNSHIGNGGKARDRDRQIPGACWIARQTPCSVRDTDSNNKVENDWGEFQPPTSGLYACIHGYIHSCLVYAHARTTPTINYELIRNQLWINYEWINNEYTNEFTCVEFSVFLMFNGSACQRHPAWKKLRILSPWDDVWPLLSHSSKGKPCT